MPKMLNRVRAIVPAARLAKAAMQGKEIKTRRDGTYEIIVNKKK